jgi:hypothetical protein
MAETVANGANVQALTSAPVIPLHFVMAERAVQTEDNILLYVLSL